MSNVYQPKRKELAKVKVVSSQYYGNNRSTLKFIGSVSRKHTNFVTTQRNVKTGKCSFIGGGCLILIVAAVVVGVVIKKRRSVL